MPTRIFSRARTLCSRAPGYAVLALLASFGAFASEGQPNAPEGSNDFRLSRTVIAAGGISRASSACFDLTSTIAEPVTGTSAAGPFALTAGFLAEPVANDSIFRSSFENCSP